MTNTVEIVEPTTLHKYSVAVCAENSMFKIKFSMTNYYGHIQSLLENVY